MMGKIFDMYGLFFSRPFFYKANKFIFLLGLRGMGILNYKNMKISGELNFLQEYLSNKQFPVVLDIGANVGGYSMQVIKTNNNAKIFAFEPHPNTFLKLKNNLYGTGAEVFNVACGQKDGLLKLYDYNRYQGSAHASLYKEVIEDIHGHTASEYDVEIIKIDDFVEQNNIQAIDLLKIDTEGNEYEVLKGALNLISEGKVKVIQFEFNEMNIVSRTYFKDFFQLLENYCFFRLVQNGLIPIKKYDSLSCEIYAFQNIVAISKNNIDNL